MADNNQDLCRFRKEILHLEATAERGDWITFPDLCEVCPWGNLYVVNHGGEPQVPPSDERGVRAAWKNIEDIYDSWKRLLQSQTAHAVKDGRELAVMLKSAYRLLSDVASSAESELRDDDNRMTFTPERCSAAVGAIRHGLARFTNDFRPQVLSLVAAVEVAIEGDGDASGQNPKPRAFSADRARWEFAKPLREKNVCWKTIANLYRKESGEKVGDKTFQSTCNRAKLAERKK